MPVSGAVSPLRQPAAVARRRPTAGTSQARYQPPGAPGHRTHAGWPPLGLRSLSPRRLTIRGERHTTHDPAAEKVHRAERRYGAFRRPITLPSHVMADALEASAQDGVLQVLVPKAPEVRAKRIPVRAGTGKAAVSGKPAVTGKAAKNGA
jgi:Hsp20/alpha crystallin family